MADPIAPPTQLYLVTPPVADGDGMIARLREVLAAGEVACVLLTVAARDDQSAKKIIKDCAAVVQPTGAALVVAGWSAVIARGGADGIHIVDGHTGLGEAIEQFKPDRIVGAGGVRSKHDAMQIADRGVDYVMFGEPSRDGRIPPLQATLERTAWWAELFEVPCVAYAPDLGAVPLLADTGADFVAVGAAIWNHEAGPAAAMRLVHDLLKQRAGAR